jgi:hypothetical protein
MSSVAGLSRGFVPLRLVPCSRAVSTHLHRMEGPLGNLPERTVRSTAGLSPLVDAPDGKTSLLHSCLGLPPGVTSATGRMGRNVAFLRLKPCTDNLFREGVTSAVIL